MLLKKNKNNLTFITFHWVYNIHVLFRTNLYDTWKSFKSNIFILPFSVNQKNPLGFYC